MRALAVDDEQLMLYALVKAIKSSDDIASVADFSDCEAALAWVRDNTVDVAFLDINMRGIGGLALAQQILEMQPDCKVIFCTGYEEYAVAAFKIHAFGYLLKPVSAEDVQREINLIKGIHDREKLLKVKCFGNFEVTHKGNKLPFKRSKSKEMLAYLIDRNGAGVSSKEICAALWEIDTEKNSKNYFHQLLLDLRTALESVGASEILEKNGYLYSVDTSKIDCDYFSYLETAKPEFRGEYMTQYPWADETCGFLWQKATDNG